MKHVQTARALLVAGALGLAAGVAQPAGAAVSVSPGLIVSPNGIQHTQNNPCIISGQNCPQQPSGFDYTNYGNISTPPDVDQTSPTYTVQQIVDAIGGNSFFVGLDVSQNSTDQQIDFFYMYVNGVISQYYDPNGLANTADNQTPIPVVNKGTAGGPGSGYADYLIGVFSLAGLNPTDQVSFRVNYDVLNDGPDQLFLVNTSDVPLPAGLPLFLTALGGLGLLGRRRRQMARA